MNTTGLSKHDQILFGLVISLQAASFQHLGKVKNPLTDAIERDLDQARGTIDILEMLKVKCRTETDAGVLNLLDTAVMELQMNYLDERRKDAAAAKEDAAAAEASPRPDGPADGAPSAGADTEAAPGASGASEAGGESPESDADRGGGATPESGG
jgi:hypothetical protein